jgi:hypothetical protein
MRASSIATRQGPFIPADTGDFGIKSNKRGGWPTRKETFFLAWDIDALLWDEAITLWRFWKEEAACGWNGGGGLWRCGEPCCRSKGSVRGIMQKRGRE